MGHTKEEAAAILEGLRGLIPYASAHVSALGGTDRASILFVISFEPRDQWQNGYLENSTYRRFHWLHDGTLDDFAWYNRNKNAPKFRKTKAADVDQVLSKIGKFISDTKKQVA